METELPPLETLRLEDLPRLGLEAQAACMSCDTLRTIAFREEVPGFSEMKPLVEMFGAGKIKCLEHGLRAMRLVIRTGGYGMRAGKVLDEWQWSG